MNRSWLEGFLEYTLDLAHKRMALAILFLVFILRFTNGSAWRTGRDRGWGGGRRGGRRCGWRDLWRGRNTLIRVEEHRRGWLIIGVQQNESQYRQRNYKNS